MNVEDQLPQREKARPVAAYTFGDWLLDSLIWCLMLSAGVGMVLYDSWVAGLTLLVMSIVVASRWYMFIYQQMPDRERGNMDKMTGFFGHVLKAIGKIIEGVTFTYFVAHLMPPHMRALRARQLAEEIPQSLEPMEETVGNPENYVLNIPLGLRKFRLEPSLLLTMIFSIITLVVLRFIVF